MGSYDGSLSRSSVGLKFEQQFARVPSGSDRLRIDNQLHLLARRTLSERRSIPDRCRQFSKFDDNDRVDAAITTCGRLSRRGSEAIKSHLRAGTNMRIAMIGAGYVGLVSGACFADFGHQVICVDKDADKIAALLRGRDSDLRARPRCAGGRQRRRPGRLDFTTDLADAGGGADAVFIAVGTPSRRGDGHADLSYVYAAAREIAAALTGFTVVVTKSTVPVGTGDEVERIDPRDRSGRRRRGGVESGVPARRRRDPRLQASRPHRGRHSTTSARAR